MNEFVLSVNGIINQAQYYGNEYIQCHIIDSFFTMVVSGIIMLLAIGGFSFSLKLFKKQNTEEWGAVIFLISIIAEIVGIACLIWGLHDYILWRTTPAGMIIEQILNECGR